MQSAYRKHHSTETTLLCMTNDILRTIDRRQDVVLVLLDLPAAFDTLMTIWSWWKDSSPTLVLKTDAELAQIIPWKPPSINNYWRSRVHSSLSALWCPTRFHTWTPTFHPIHCPSAGCDCSPWPQLFVLCRWHSIIYSYRSCKSGPVPDCPPNLHWGRNAMEYPKYAEK